MAVKLRLVRMGKKKQPTYRVVAADSRSPRDGRFLEIVGTYAPRGSSTAEPDAVIKIDNAKAVKWLVNGAQPTERVERLLKTSGRLGRVRRSEGEVTNLYEAGDINQTDGDDDDVDDEFDDEVGEGNEARPEPTGGTPLAVLTYLARSLSNDPDAVVIDTEERRGALRLSLHVAPDDMGRVIGRRGPHGPGHPHAGQRGGRQGRRPGQRRHRRRLSCSKSAGSPRPTACGARWSSSSGPTRTNG